MKRNGRHKSVNSFHFISQTGNLETGSGSLTLRTCAENQPINPVLKMGLHQSCWGMEVAPPAMGTAAVATPGAPRHRPRSSDTPPRGSPRRTETPLPAAKVGLASRASTRRGVLGDRPPAAPRCAPLDPRAPGLALAVTPIITPILLPYPSTTQGLGAFFCPQPILFWNDVLQNSWHLRRMSEDE